MSLRSSPLHSNESSRDHVRQNRCGACQQETSESYREACDRFYARQKPYQLLRCGSCGLVWIDNPPSPTEMAAHYGPAYDAFIRRATEERSSTHWSGALRVIHMYKSGGALLDVGCGSGAFFRCLDSAAWNLWGIEMSTEAAEVARSRNLATILTGDILQIHLPPESFDVITCFHVFEHMISPREVLARVREWLRPGGVFCVHVPNIEAAEERLFRSYWYPLELPRHLYHYSPRSLRRLAEASGLEEVSVTTAKISFVEYSVRYLLDDLLRKAGISRPPLAEAEVPPLAWRAIRKGLRLTVLPFVNWLIGLTGDGSIIEAVFRKP